MVIYNLIFLLLVTANLVNSQPNSLFLSSDGLSKDNLNHVNFFNDTFKQFIKWLVENDRPKCVLGFAFDYNSSDKIVTSVDIFAPTSSVGDGSISCQQNSSGNQVACQRNPSLCNGTLCQTFGVCGLSSVAKCVSMLWTFPNERLIYNSTLDNIQECGSLCPQATSSITFLTNTPSTSQTSDLTSHLVTDSTSRFMTTVSPSGNYHDQQTENNNLPIIIGVVCGALVLVIVVIIGFLLWRRRQFQANKSSESRSHVISSASGANSVSDIPSCTKDYQNIFPETGHNSDKLKQVANSNIPSRYTESGYYKTEEDINGYRYNNVLDQLDKQSKGITDTNKENDSDYDYNYIGDKEQDVIASGHEHYFVNANAEEDYSMAKNVGGKLQINHAYSKLGEIETVIKNPYNIIPLENTPGHDYEYTSNKEVPVMAVPKISDVDEGYTITRDVTNSVDVWNKSQEDEISDDEAITSETTGDYSRLGENIDTKVNTYNSLLKLTADPKTKKPPPNPKPGRLEQEKREDFNNFRTETNFQPTGKSTQTRQHGEHSDLKSDKDKNTDLTHSEFPEYSAVKK